MYQLTEEIAGIEPSIDKSKILVFNDFDLDKCLSYIDTTLKHSCTLYKNNLKITLTYFIKENE